MWSPTVTSRKCIALREQALDLDGSQLPPACVTLCSWANWVAWGTDAISSQSNWVPILAPPLGSYVTLCHQLNLPRELSSLPIK